MAGLMARFREQRGPFGRLSGAIPGMLARAGPLGQDQRFAMAGALRHPGAPSPMTIGGGLGEPRALSAVKHLSRSRDLRRCRLTSRIAGAGGEGRACAASRFSL